MLFTTTTLLSCLLVASAHATELHGGLPEPNYVSLVPQRFNLPRVDAVDPRNELTVEKFKIGPWTLKPKQVLQTANVYLPRPKMTETIEVASFGRFAVVDPDDNVIERSQLYFHHILAYDQSNRHFVAGASAELTDWGPHDLPYPYRLILKSNAAVKAQGFHMNNLKDNTFTFYITYEVHYKVHNPEHPAIRVTESFYWMDNFNVPGGNLRNSTYERTRSVSIPKDMVIISMNGHLHQGGKRLIAKFADSTRSPNELCIAYNLYHESYPCVWDCEDICPYKNDWTFQWKTTTCYMELPVRKNEKVFSISEYDNSCKWRGVMAWWFNYGWDGSFMGKQEVAAEPASQPAVDSAPAKVDAPSVLKVKT